MILTRTLLLLCVVLFVVALPSATTRDVESADEVSLVARGRPSRPPGAKGGPPPWVRKYAGGKFPGGGSKAKTDFQAGSQQQPQADAGQNQQQDSSKSQPQGDASSGSGSSGGSGSAVGKGRKGGSGGQSQSQPQGQSSDNSQQQKPQQAQPAASSGGSSGGYMGVVSKWRSAMGLADLAQDSKLEGNAMDTSQSANGQLKHKLNSGSMGQVMAPGNSGNFESVFVGGWLCEMPSLPGLGSSTCNSMSKGWNHAGQTGHAQILSDPKYKKIGCALATGIWTCDVA